MLRLVSLCLLALLPPSHCFRLDRKHTKGVHTSVAVAEESENLVKSVVDGRQWAAQLIDGFKKRIDAEGEDGIDYSKLRDALHFAKTLQAVTNEEDNYKTLTPDLLKQIKGEYLKDWKKATNLRKPVIAVRIELFDKAAAVGLDVTKREVQKAIGFYTVFEAGCAPMFASAGYDTQMAAAPPQPARVAAAPNVTMKTTAHAVVEDPMLKQLQDRLDEEGLSFEDLPTSDDKEFNDLLEELGFKSAVLRAKMRKAVRAQGLVESVDK